jgi:hypothetical protein
MHKEMVLELVLVLELRNCLRMKMKLVVGTQIVFGLRP